MRARKRLPLFTLFALGAVFTVSAVRGADWPSINAQAREQARTPIRPGEPGKRSFWNAQARMFLHPPAFDFERVDGAGSYRFTLTREDDGTSTTWMSECPWSSVPGDVWDAQAPGAVSLKVEGVDASGRAVGVSGERAFWRAACFRGPYAYASRSYGLAAERCHCAVYSLSHVRAWETADEPPEGYDLYCYPAKILSAMIRSLVRCARRQPPESDRALRIARKMADWMIAHSQPIGAPLAHFPPTYWGNRREEAVRCRGLNMLSYPASAAEAYLELFEATGETRYREESIAIMRTYLKLQGGDGTWPLFVRESDGEPVRANRLLPVGTLHEMLVRIGTITGEKEFGAAAERAFDFVHNGPCVTWNWDAQFEDQDPKPPYENLQKGDAVRAATELFARGLVDEGREIIDWCEDQFVVWSDPLHHQRWREWRLPVALEQYNYYKPIDASIADMICGFAAAWKATGERLYLEKARALADNLVNGQRRDGTFPTYFDGYEGSDWVNCMFASALALEGFEEIVRRADDPPVPERLAIWPEGKMPSAQTNQTYAPYLEWHTPKVLRSKTVIISVSGGSYMSSGNDGFEVTPIRNYLLDKGVTVVAMRYRAPRPVGLPKHLTAWQDAQRAVRIVRREAIRRGLDPNRIGFTGCSAGGHLTTLAAVSSTLPAYDRIDALDDTPCNINFAVPVYPAYVLVPEAEKGDVMGCDDLSAALCPEFAFDAKTPPMCLVHGDADGWSPMGSVRIYHKLRMMKIPTELHIMSGEGHCFMEHPRIGTPAANWKDRVWEWMAKSGFVDAPVFSVSHYGAAGDGVANDTVAIQAAIDAAEEAGGGTVFFEPGTYISGTIYLKDGTDLHLGAGAVLKGSTNRADYCAADFVPQNWASPRTGDNTSGGHLVVAVGRRNVTLRGPGKIDGSGSAFLLDGSGRQWENWKAGIPWRPGQMIWICDCENVRIADLEMADSPYWTCNLLNCDTVAITGCNVHNERNRFQTWNGDGIDIDRCRDVTIRDCRIDTTDDCLTLRASCARRLAHPKDCERVRVSNCRLASSCNAVRIGVGEGRIHDATLENLVIEDTRYAFNVIGAFSPRNRGTDIECVCVSNVVVEADQFLWMHHGHSTEALFKDIVFRSVSGRVKHPSLVDAKPMRPFEGIRFEDVDLSLGVVVRNADVGFRGGTFGKCVDTGPK